MMMNEKKSEFKIGLTVLLALLILMFGILWGKQVRLTSGAVPVYVHFVDIAGLEQGAPVLVNGVRSGVVKELRLQQDGVVVFLAVAKNVNIYKDARFEVTSPELMGGKVINIFPGTSGVKPDQEYIFTGEIGGGMDQLMKMSTELVADVKHLLAALEVTIENINKTAGDPKLHEAFLSSIRNLDESSERTLELITLNEGKLNQVMDNLVSSSQFIRSLLENNSDDIHRAVTNFDLFVAQLNELASGLNQIADKLKSDQGSLGVLINDDEFANKLNHTLTDLDSLITQIKEQGIQTNISLFGRRKK